MSEQRPDQRPEVRPPEFRPPEFRPEEPEEEDRRITKSLAGLAVALAIIVVGLFLAEHLKSLSDLEDCMLAHHTSCTEIH